MKIFQFNIFLRKALIEAKDENGRTPLHKACQNGYLPVVQYLIEKGANIKAKDEYHWTPLYIACFKCHLQIVQYLNGKGFLI